MVAMVTVSVAHFKWSPQLERYKLCVMILLISTVNPLFMETVLTNVETITNMMNKFTTILLL